MKNGLLILGKEKENYTSDNLYIESDNVYFTEANVFKLNGNIYSIDDTCKVNRNDIVDGINNGDDVIIKIDSSFLVAVIIPRSLETKLKNAIDNEDYELAKIINNQIKNMEYADKWDCFFFRPCGIIFLILLVLKITTIISVSWWIVFTPIIIPILVLWWELSKNAGFLYIKQNYGTRNEKIHRHFQTETN